MVLLCFSFSLSTPAAWRRQLYVTYLVVNLHHTIFKLKGAPLTLVAACVMPQVPAP